MTNFVIPLWTASKQYPEQIKNKKNTAEQVHQSNNIR